MINLTSKIEQWAVERNLHTAEPHKQAIKLGEVFNLMPLMKKLKVTWDDIKEVRC